MKFGLKCPSGAPALGGVFSLGSLVAGSGRVAVEEVVASVAESASVTGRAQDRRRHGAQTAVTGRV